MVRKKQTEKTKAETKNRNKQKNKSRKGGEHHEETDYVPGRVF